MNGFTTMKCLEIVRFELVFQLRRRSTWLLFALFLFPLIGVTNDDLIDARNGEILFNAPLFVAQSSVIMSVSRGREHGARVRRFRAEADEPISRLLFTESIRRPLLLAQLLTLFSCLALLLAAVGTYGVLAFMVAERRREMGIRLALGAQRGRLLRHVMTEELTPAGLGIVVGFVGALGLTRFLRSLLFGVEPMDAVAMAVAMSTVAGMAALACWVPAWRASRLDPNVVLRVE